MERERVTGAKGNGERESDRSQRKWRERVTGAKGNGEKE